MSSTSFSAADQALLERLLANEVDMAFRRRVITLLGFLEIDDDFDLLDCGCGMGFYLLAMQHLRPGARLTGLDSEAASLRHAEQNGVRATLVSGDAQALPFDDESFDRVLMSEVLEHLPDDTAALREAYRVLRPGGVLAISVPHARYPFWWDPINATWGALGGKPIRRGPIVGIWTNHERLYEPQELIGLVRAAGLEVEEAQEATHHTVPFTHFLVYGVGKPLIERGLLPRRLRASADRFAGLENRGSALDPFNALRRVFRYVDALNERPGRARRKTFVNVLLKARKPLVDVPALRSRGTNAAGEEDDERGGEQRQHV